MKKMILTKTTAMKRLLFFLFRKQFKEVFTEGLISGNRRTEGTFVDKSNQRAINVYYKISIKRLLTQ